MPEVAQLEKATLQEIRWKGTQVETKDADGKDTKPFKVQFNPQTLKVAYANQKAGGDQPKGSSVQFVGKGTTKLTLELWFDTTITETKGPDADPVDVRNQTRQVFQLMEPKPAPGKNKKNFIPPGVRFQWGAFLFEGVIDAMDETIEFFSSTGVPLRASVSVTISQQELQFKQLPGKKEGPGTGPLEQARAGDSVQSVADRKGDGDWKQAALANGIENPRRLAPGTLLDFSAGASASASLGGSLDLSGGVGLSASGSVRLGAVGGASGGAISLGFVSASASGGATGSFGVSGGISGGISAGLSGGAGISGGLSAGAGIGGGIGLSAGASAGLGAGASAGLGASASASASADLSGSASASADAELR